MKQNPAPNAFSPTTNFKCVVPILVALLVGLTMVAHAQTPTYKDARAPLETRVADLMSRLTDDEKISLLSGTDFTTKPIARLGIPVMAMADAGQGVRGGSDSTLGPATAFPAGVAMASTWNPALVGKVGAQIGIEAQNKGTGLQLMLGPAVNIQRSPLGGRNGEYFSEDPFLSGKMGVGYIRGMQGTGTVACIKHFICNNEEDDRFTVNVLVSERALREIYMPSFEMGVKDGGVWTVMSSYNRINGPFASANEYLLTDVLKRGWGFDGAVMSDWGGAHPGTRIIRAGNDLEMPDRGFLAPEKVRLALERGTATMEQVNENATRIVRTILRSGVIDGVKKPDPALVNSQASRAVALKTAQEGIVLLKNERALLPLDASKIRSIAVFGAGGRELQMGAAGSPGVTPLRFVGPLQGITERAGANVKVSYIAGDTSGNAFPAGSIKAPDGRNGFRAEYFDNTNLQGAPTSTRTDEQIDFNVPIVGLVTDRYSVRWTGTFTPRVSGPTQLLFRADDGARLFVDDKLVIDHWVDGAANTQTATANLVAGQPVKLRAEYYQAGGAAIAQLRVIEPNSDPFAEVTNAARSSDVAVVVVTTRGTESEGQDRPSMSLPNGQDELIRRVAAANPRTIVILNNGTPVAMPWLGSVPALVESWFPGQEGGTALAQILFGDVNPSGHLPTTLGARREDYPDYPNFGGDGRTVRYEEGIFVGYRGFDKKKIAPLYPFGYGLSYTNFRIDNLKLSAPTLAANRTITANVRVTNTGKKAGAQVVQLYVRDPNPKVEKAVRELKGFSKVFLQPGQSQTVSLPLSPRDFAWCDTTAKGWRVDAGHYFVEVGDSSRNLTQKVALPVAAWFQPIPFMNEQTAIPPVETAPDLALHKRAFASSINGEHQPNRAFDNDIKTRWQAGGGDGQWLAVDLGAPQKIGRVFLNWETAGANAYRIEVSDDGQNWREVYSTDKSEGSEEDVTFAPVTARYARMFGVQRSTNFGFSLFDFEVRAPKN